MKKYDLSPKASHCPTCSTEHGLVLYSVEAEQAAQHFVLREVHPERHRALKAHIEYLWQQSTCYVVRCTNCEFCFADPFVAGDARFYELAYERSGYPSWKWEFERTLATLTELGEANELQDFSLLEVGAGDGAFIKRVAPALTPKHNVLCTEYSDYGIDAIQTYGVECRAQDIRELPLDRYADHFDVICMFQVLEHLDGIDELFSRINSLSKKAAHLFIAVPNANRIEFNELHGSLLDMPPNHVGRWNAKSFELIAHRHGWRLITHEVEQDAPLKKLVRHALYRYGRKRRESGTLGNRIERIGWVPTRRILQAVAVCLYATASLPTIYTLLRDPTMGDSQWVHLQKGEG